MSNPTHSAQDAGMTPKLAFDVDQVLFLRLRALAQFVDSEIANLSLLNAAERFAMSLVFNRSEWLDQERHSALSAVCYIGDEWTKAAAAVQYLGWACRRRPALGAQEAPHD